MIVWHSPEVPMEYEVNLISEEEMDRLPPRTLGPWPWVMDRTGRVWPEPTTKGELWRVELYNVFTDSRVDEPL